MWTTDLMASSQPAPSEQAVLMLEEAGRVDERADELAQEFAFGDVAPVDVDVGLAGDRCDREGEDAIAAFELGLLDLGGA